MPWEEFETTIPDLQQAKIVHALDLASTVIGQLIIRVIKSRKKGLAGHAKCMQRWEMYTKYLTEKSEESNRFENVGMCR
jgi:hypothetical protein